MKDLTEKGAVHERSETHKKLSTITEETALFTEIKDIRDELNIILTVLQDQRNVLRPLTAIINESTHEAASGGKDKTGHLRPMPEEVAKAANVMYDEHYRAVDTNIKDFELMREHAKDIYDSVGAESVESLAKPLIRSAQPHFES